MDATYQPSDDIFSTIIQRYNELTRSATKIADYILSHKEQIPTFGIAELASACDVSDATVSRFCHSIGCNSYNEFRLMAVHALSGSDALSLGADLYEGLRPEDSLAQKANKLCNIGIQSLQQTLAVMDYERISKVVQLFTAARAVYCFGQGNSSIVAEDAWGRFTCISPKFHYISNTRLQANTAALLGSNDVILYFSYSGAIPELEEIGEIIEKNGAKLVLVTRFPNSAGSRYADHLLLCGANEAPHQQGSIAAKIGQLFIVDVLFHEFCAHNQIPFQQSGPQIIK